MEIVLYHNYYLRPDNNKVIDDITTFLENTSGSIETTTYISQYLKPALEYEIKVERSLNVATDPQIKSTSFFNYAWLKFLGFPVFCFVLSSEWVSEKTIKLKLKVDVLNTYHYSHLSVSPRTFIHRQHKDRYDSNRMPIIDKTSECLSFPLIAKEKNHKIYHQRGAFDAYTGNIYLIFKSPEPVSSDIPNPIIYCEICADVPIHFPNDSGGSITYQQVNLADTRLIKIIQIPYFPTSDFLYNSSTGYIDIVGHQSNFEYIGVDSLFRFKDTSVFKDGLFLSNMDVRVFSGYSDLNRPLNTSEIIYRPFEKKYEPKLYHSDFFIFKYFYDSFSKQIKMEQFSSGNIINISFYMSQNAMSRFMFKFNYTYKYYEEDYEEFLTISRNNEKTIYTNAFLSYLQTGYNYDVKNKERQEIFKGITTGLQVGTSAGKMMSGEGEAVFGLANSLLGAINFKLSSDSALEEKIHTLQMQGTSVLNSDDVDLLEIYNENKLCYSTYELREEDENFLLNLFHYNGYRVEKYGVPDFTSRKFFNYVSCELVIDHMPFGFQVANYEAFKELLQKYKEGVYIIHKYIQSEQPRWDVKMEYENWETFLPFTE